MLDVEELREHTGPGPSDERLGRLLEAAIQAINERYGPGADGEDISELLTPSGSLVHLSRRALGVSEVKEGSVVLDYTDYALRPGGKLLQRLHDGEPVNWRARVDVSYAPFPDDEERNRIAIALVQLDLSYQPGLTGITIGSWTEQYAQGDRTYRKERDAILRTLRHPTVGVW